MLSRPRQWRKYVLLGASCIVTLTSWETAEGWQTTGSREFPRASVGRRRESEPPRAERSSANGQIPTRSFARDVALSGGQIETSRTVRPAIAEEPVDSVNSGGSRERSSGGAEGRRAGAAVPVSTFPVGSSGAHAAERAPLPPDDQERSTRRAERPIALAPPSSLRAEGTRRGVSSGSGRAITTVTTSLAIVLGAFALLAWFSRRNMPAAMQRLPTEVVQLLGRAPLDGRQQLQLLRFGHKLVLLNVTSGGAETLTEITDADEVHRLTSLCLQSQPNSVSNTFREVLAQLGEQPQRSGLSAKAEANEPSAAIRGPTRRRGEGSIHG